jgi:predicted RNA binding protein YcfA (HicA-like mRNA interferase family)
MLGSMVGIVPTMKSGEVIRRLEADGWRLARVKGSHHQFKKSGVALIVTVPHPERDIPTGTLRNIFRCAGWDWK